MSDFDAGGKDLPRFRISILPIKQYLNESGIEQQDHAVVMMSSYPKPSLPDNIPSLFLAIDDVTNPFRPNAFTVKDAWRVTEFLGRLSSGTSLFICCDGGVSRSAALAAALTYGQEGDDSYIWENPRYHPNLLVYERMRTALRCPCSATELEEKETMSEEALKRKIESASS